jgi:hypothetical protein
VQLLQALEQSYAAAAVGGASRVPFLQQFMDPDAAIAAALLLMDGHPEGLLLTRPAEALACLKQISAGDGQGNSSWAIALAKFEHAAVAGQGQAEKLCAEGGILAALLGFGQKSLSARCQGWLGCLSHARGCLWASSQNSESEV